MLLGYVAKAQYQINIIYNNPKDSVLHFRLSTFDDKLFLPKDTVKVVKNKAKFASATSVFGGIYAIYLPTSKKKIQLCIENKDMMTLTLNGNDLTDSITCSDPENNLFIKYQSLENSFHYLDSQYNELQKRGNATLRLKEEMYSKKREALINFRNNALKTIKPKGLLHKYFTILNQIDAFKPDKQDIQAREYFINQFNLKNQQLYFSPVIKQILYEYLSAYPLVADSITKGMDVVMSKLNCKDKPYPNTFNYFASVLQNSSIRENTKGYTNFIEKYLINNTCTFLPQSKADEFRSSYSRMKDIVKLDTAINIILKDTSGKTQELTHHINQHDYTVISFYDPSCEHCKYQMPELDSTLKTIRAQQGISVLNFAICNTSTVMEKSWKAFINEHKMDDHYVHVILGEENTIRNTYGAYSNPLFYLCDRKGNILIKKGTAANIASYIKRNSINNK